MKLPKPPIAYFFSLLVVVVPQAFRKMLESQKFWESVPFYWLSLLGVAFGVGLVVQDLYNSQSWLRSYWREWRRIFNVKLADSVLIHTPHEYVAIRCRIQFTKKLKAPKLTVRLHEHLLFEMRSHIVQREILSDQEKDAELSLLLGSIPISSPGWTPRQAVWGPLLGGEARKDDQFSISGGVRYTLEVVVDSQTYRIYVHTPLNADVAMAQAYVLPEDDVPLAHI